MVWLIFERFNFDRTWCRELVQSCVWKVMELLSPTTWDFSTDLTGDRDVPISGKCDENSSPTWMLWCKTRDPGFTSPSQWKWVPEPAGPNWNPEDWDSNKRVCLWSSRGNVPFDHTYRWGIIWQSLWEILFPVFWSQDILEDQSISGQMEMPDGGMFDKMPTSHPWDW